MQTSKALSLMVFLGLMSQAQTTFAQKLPSIFSSKPYIEAGVGHDHLSNNYAHWQHQYVDWMLPMQERGLIYIQALNAQRYDQQDSSIYVNFAYPQQFGVISVDVSHAGNANFLVKNSHGFMWSGYTPYGLQYLMGAKRNQYTESKTENLSLGIETYIRNWRFAYLATHSNLNDIQSGWVNRYQWQWLSDINRVGITYISGQEPGVLGPSVITNTSIKTYQLDGIYGFARNYALTAMLWHTQQGSFYQRNGIQFGVRVSY